MARIRRVDCSAPGLTRKRTAESLAGRGLDRDRVLACAVRLLDRGFFRIGTEDYAEQNHTYGLATMLKRHARVDGNQIAFDCPSKGGRRYLASVVDPEVAAVVAALKRRTGGGRELLAYREHGAWVDLRSEDINAWIKERTGGDGTAKDFRTWKATVLAAVALSTSWPAASSRTARTRAISGRSRRSPTTSATPRRCAAPPTSTRACSTASAPAGRSPWISSPTWTSPASPPTRARSNWRCWT
jgi:DNA topoisomerase I